VEIFEPLFHGALEALVEERPGVPLAAAFCDSHDQFAHRIFPEGERWSLFCGAGRRVACGWTLICC
jgi:hypothetical protein